MSISDAIAQIIREKDRGILSGEQAMLKVLEELRRDTLAQIAGASTEWQASYLPKYMAAVEDAVKRWKVKAAADIASKQEDMWSFGRELIEKPLYDAGLAVALPFISTHVLEQMQDFARLKISQVGSDAMYRIQSELTLGMTGAKSSQDVIAAVGRNLDNPSIFTSISARALAITKHESGKVFSKASQENMAEANKTLKGELRKQWSHAGHPKAARTSHLEADGQIVGVDEPFILPGTGVEIMYPRDDSAPLEETMGCGCDSLPFMYQWAEVG
jgi:hypothetical protein